ncbi:MAG: methyltransferase domain-containing protein [Chloroflexi bacterium]|nr:MAG: methyltransferase domain-containing protein [Chloroflexota bacterium]
MDQINEAVRSRYADAARQIAVLPEDSTAGCCCVDGPDCGCAGTYSAEETAAIGLTDAVSLGCGNPTVLADLRPGEIVLDLGSGAGLDVLLSARRVLPGGHAYGVDMTDEMLDLANRNRDRARLKNATFLKGSIENVPLPDGSDGDEVEVRGLDRGLLEGEVEEAGQSLEVVAGRELGHDAAEVLVQVHLGVDDVGQDLAAVLDNRDRGLVAACFDAEGQQSSFAPLTPHPSPLRGEGKIRASAICLAAASVLTPSRSACVRIS